MKNLSRICVPIVGVAGLLAASFGLWYNGGSILVAVSGGFSEFRKQQHLTYFYLAYWTMSAICIALHLLLVICCLDLLRGKLRWSWLLTGLLLFEVLYFVSIGALWLLPTAIGKSIAAATGVANGGLMGQFYILFPLWAPLVLAWARRQQRKNATVFFATGSAN